MGDLDNQQTLFSSPAPEIFPLKAIPSEYQHFNRSVSSIGTDDLLLVAWLLTLTRYREDKVIKLSWKCKSIAQKGQSNFVFSEFISIPGTSLEKCGSILECLEIVSSHRHKVIKVGGLIADPEDYILVLDDSDSGDGGSESNKWNIQLEVQLQGGNLELRTVWREPETTEYMARRYASSIKEILEAIISDPTIEVSKIVGIGNADLSQVWKWNRDLPPKIEKCMHSFISERATVNPTKTAISSWDGELSYREVDRFSTHLACKIHSLGLEKGQRIPICFEKSRWTVVAVLAVMKAGGTFVLMDPSQPAARLRIIAEQVHATLVITSRKQKGLGFEISPQSKVEIVEEAMFATNELLGYDLLPVTPSTILYLIFTSGSTGKPKGVMISHETYTSSAFPRSEGVGYDSESRVLDFASYAFDVSIDSMLCTLLHGGCLCIPSDEERLNDLSGAIRRMGITMANLTPSVARILDDDIIPSLRSLGLGGESAPASDVMKWGQYTRIPIGYGPSECTVGCTVTSNAAQGRHYVNIGKGSGGIMWITDPDDHNCLVPVGAIGELLVEGPIVGQGYLNDEERTAEVFIENPSWLTAGYHDCPGRTGRLYKTGDLVKYDPDGSGCLVFMGRKDTQVKLRGQRVELGEIEYHLRSHLPQDVGVCVEVILPQARTNAPTLVAFITRPKNSTSDPQAGSLPEIRRATLSLDIQELVDGMGARLSNNLPSYMVPAIYIPISHLPMLVSGKTDRKRLREFGSTITIQESKGTTTPSQAFAEEVSQVPENDLRKLWAGIFNISEEHIDSSSNFFSLGGDSLTAMKLVSRAREGGISLKTEDVLMFPRLLDMVRATKRICSDAVDHIPSFSLLDRDWDLGKFRLETAEYCGIKTSSIEDIYQCSPLQETLMAFSARAATSYVAQRVAEIPSEDDIAKFEAAWDSTVSGSPILRTRIVQLPDRPLMQVVVKNGIMWNYANNLNEYLEGDKNKPMELGEPLTRFAIVREHTDTKIYFIWTVHHALYDGWSTPLILRRVRNAFAGSDTPRTSQMKHFIKYIRDSDHEKSKLFWQNELKGATGSQFPITPSRTYLPEADSVQERYIHVHKHQRGTITIPTIIRAAWALVASQYTENDDVVFGETFSGRGIPIPGAEQIEGPMITTIPTRIKIDRNSTVQRLLETIQEQGLCRMQHEYLGTQNIRKISPDAQFACELKTGLVIQPMAEDNVSEQQEIAFRSTDAAREALHFNSYPLMLACSLELDGFLMMASFDSKLVGAQQMQRVLAQFDHFIQKISQNLQIKVKDIDSLSEVDHADIWSWNVNAPARVDEERGNLIPHLAEQTLVGERYPSLTVPWIVDQFNQDRLAPIGTVGELVFEGPLSTSEFLENPPWLLAGCKGVSGRNGRVHMTRSLAKYNENGQICYLGPKEAPKAFLNGQAINLEEVEYQVQNLLKPSLVAAHIIDDHSEPNSNAESKKRLVVFLEARSDEKVSPDISFQVYPEGWPAHQRDLEQYIAASLPLNTLQQLTTEIRELQDILPPHMTPIDYIPLKQLPMTSLGLNRSMIEKISLMITQDFLIRVENALDRAKTRRPSEESRISEQGRKLLGLWSDVLGVDFTAISTNDTFFRLGGDSIMAMKLVSKARLAGFKLTVKDVFQSTRFSEMLKILEAQDPPRVSDISYKAFSLLNIPNINVFLKEEVIPRLKDSELSIEEIEDVFPVTDSQARDIDSTTNVPRSSVQYNMLYLCKTIDTDRLSTCCEQLVSKHSILRTLFIEQNGRYLQVVPRKITLPVVKLVRGCDDDGDNIKEWSQKVCSQDIENDFPLGSPFLKFFLVNGKDKNSLIIRLSHAQYDGISLPELIRDLCSLYEGNVVPETLSFSRYIEKMLQDSNPQTFEHWRRVLKGSNLSILQRPGESPSDSIFISRGIKITENPGEYTMATILTASWAYILAQNLVVTDVTFGGISTGRNVDLSGVENIVGPCYQFVPIRVKFEDNWTVSDLLKYVQQEHLRNSPFESIGFKSLTANCTDWPAETSFYDSLVHYQGVEYFDTIPFASTTCGVDMAIPHPEPSTPMKVISYPKDGFMYYGIVSSEANRTFSTARLDELCETVSKFTSNQSAKISLKR